jgi:U4/U6.U5 tri-snRNP-associated protein 1
MCWIFIEGPGKNKIEKRKKRELLNQRMKAIQPGESTMMRLLKDHQKRSDEAHMVFSRHK